MTPCALETFLNPAFTSLSAASLLFLPVLQTVTTSLSFHALKCSACFSISANGILIACFTCPSLYSLASLTSITRYFSFSLSSFSILFNSSPFSSFTATVPLLLLELLFEAEEQPAKDKDNTAAILTTNNLLYFIILTPLLLLSYIV